MFFGSVARPADELERRDERGHALEERVVGDEHRAVRNRAHREHAVNRMALHLLPREPRPQVPHERTEELRPAFGKRQQREIADHLVRGGLLRRIVGKPVVDLSLKVEAREQSVMRLRAW